MLIASAFLAARFARGEECACSRSALYVQARAEVLAEQTASTSGFLVGDAGALREGHQALLEGRVAARDEGLQDLRTGSAHSFTENTQFQLDF